MTRKTKGNGQSLAEFSLILPILLLLLLGVFEAGRIMWAYITVQSAAREAARYAITGKPYIEGDGVSNPSCLVPEGDEAIVGDFGSPWKCTAKDRATAIKTLAISRGLTLVGGNLDNMPQCLTPLPANDTTTDLSEWNCDAQSNVFGVEVAGQTTENNIFDGGSPTKTVSIRDYAGDQGLNVEVYTFYNVKMMTPVFDVVMGQSPVTVRGRVQMQNEGINSALGSVPPPAIRPKPEFGPGSNPCQQVGLCGDESQEILSLSGYGQDGTIQVGMDILVQIKEHDQTQTYDIYLQSIPEGDEVIVRYPVGQSIPTDSDYQWGGKSGEGAVSLTGIPAGDYCLYSVVAGATDHNCNVNPLAKAAQSLSISSTGGGAFIVLKDDSVSSNSIGGVKVWAARSKIDVSLFEHDVEEYDIYLTYGNGASKQTKISTRLDVSTDGQTVSSGVWRLQPSPEPPPSPCPPSGGKPCEIESRIAMTGVGASAYTITEIYITDPELTLLGEVEQTYRRGDTIQVRLTDHTPNRTYNIIVTNFLTDSETVGDVIYASSEVTVNNDGNSNVINIPLVDGAEEWTAGTYVVGSYLVEATSSTLEDNWIAPREEAQRFTIDTSNDPYITIVDVSSNNYEFPIGTMLNIKLHNHAEGAYTIWLGGTNDALINDQVPTQEANDAIMVTVTDDSPVTEYTIPLNAASGGATLDYKIASFVGGNDGSASSGNFDNATAFIDVRIIPQPVIEVYEDGKQVDYPTASLNRPSSWPSLNSQYAVLPDATVTIELKNHASNTNYKIFYASNTNGEKDILFGRGGSVQTNSSGQASISYNLDNLPRTPGYDLTVPSNWGKPFDIYTRPDSSSSGKVATTTLTLRPVDLLAKNISPDGAILAEGQGTPYINQPYTVTFTIQNSATVPISRYFDIDFYHSPAPIVPGQITDTSVFNAPGDYKTWVTESSGGCQLPIPANGSCSVRQAFTLTQYGGHDFYARVNTSRFVDEVYETNNVATADATLTCKATATTKTETFGPAEIEYVNGPMIDFSAGYDLANNWTAHGFKDSPPPSPSIEGDTLVLEHYDSPILNAHNDKMGGYYYNQQITDQDNTLSYVQVEIVDAPVGVSSGSKSYDKDVSTYQDPALAGIALRKDGPVNAESTGVQDERQMVYFALGWSDTNQNFKLFAGYRGAPITNDNMDYEESDTVRIQPSQLPVKLRINKNEADFTFEYTTNDAPNSWLTFKDEDTNKAVSMPFVIGQELYGMLFAVNNKTSDYLESSSTKFDNFTYQTQRDKAAEFAQWVDQPYGIASGVDSGYFKPRIKDASGSSNDYLVLESKGELNIYTRSDDSDSSGYFFLHYTGIGDISTASGFEASVTINDIENTEVAGGRVGLEIRNSLDDGSGKVQYSIERFKKEDDTYAYAPQVIYRSDGGSSRKLFTDTTQYISDGQDVTLKIQREETTGLFKFFYNGPELALDISADIQAEGITDQIIADTINDKVEVGLFNDSGDRTTLQATEIVRFQVQYNDCEPGAEDTGTLLNSSGLPNDPPANLTLCPNPLSESSFENTGFWVTHGQSFRSGGSANEGSYKLSAPTNNKNNPYFYQKIRLPDWIIDGSTTINLDLAVNIDDYLELEPLDVFRVALVTSPPTGIGTPDDATLITEKIEVANGGTRSTAGISYDSTVWDNVSLSMPLRLGIKLSDYQDKDLYLVFYNDSNGENCAQIGECRRTRFNFDDVELATCTTQPSPELNTLQYPTHVQGRVIIYEDGITPELAEVGLKVWAYSEGGELYETYTIQGGRYDFYGLPADSFSSGGTRYFIYAEKVVQSGNVAIPLSADNQVVLEVDRYNEFTNIDLSLFQVAAPIQIK
ncbi:pilus assembly protein [Anaerolineales bacterium HSG25]|nr:pilus assembly protein [Anaerolineales bacterium HSG25]